MFGRKEKTRDDHWTGSIGHKMAAIISDAKKEGTDAVYHGGCIGCIWLKGNTTVEGIKLCLGCSYSQWNRSLPDLSITDYDLRHVNR